MENFAVEKFPVEKFPVETSQVGKFTSEEICPFGNLRKLSCQQ